MRLSTVASPRALCNFHGHVCRAPELYNTCHISVPFPPLFPPTVLWFEDRVVEVPLPRAFARPHEPLSLVEHRFTDTALVLDQASRRSLRPHCGLAPGNTLDSTSRLHAMFHLHVHYVRMQCFTCIRILRWLRERILKADPTKSNQRIL